MHILEDEISFRNIKLICINYHSKYENSQEEATGILTVTMVEVLGVVLLKNIFFSF